MVALTARLSDLAADVLLTSVHVQDVRELAPRFLAVRIGCDAFTHAAWVPGDKLQLRPRRGSLAMRTYTPTGWNVDDGTTELIAYRHGQGAAGRWFDDAAGSTGAVFGPSRSVDLSDTAPTTIFVGDETSVGLACVLERLTPDARYLFEATNPDDLRGVLTAVGVPDRATITVKDADRGALLRSILEAVERCANSPVDLVVTGDAATVSAVRRGLRRHPGSSLRIKARAYWAQGRTGLS